MALIGVELQRGWTQNESRQFTIQSNVDWLSPDSYGEFPNGEQTATFEITTFANSTSSSRSGSIYVQSNPEGVWEATLPVTQDGATPFLTTDGANDLSINFVTSGGTETFPVESSSAWNVIDGLSFGTISPQSGPAGITNVTIVVPANTGDERSDTVQFKNSDNIMCQVDVWQGGVPAQPTDITYAVTYLNNVPDQYPFEVADFAVTEYYTDGSQQTSASGYAEPNEGFGSFILERPAGKTVASRTIAGYVTYFNTSNGKITLTATSGGSGSITFGKNDDNSFEFAVTSENITVSASYSN
jgi:hypothetical protein